MYMHTYMHIAHTHTIYPSLLHEIAWCSFPFSSAAVLFSVLFLFVPVFDDDLRVNLLHSTAAIIQHKHTHTHIHTDKSTLCTQNWDTITTLANTGKRVQRYKIQTLLNEYIYIFIYITWQIYSIHLQCVILARNRIIQ